ncbi:MAG: hypothetical protein HFE66_07040 [Clostridiales bacterium]|jgi:hypothetical protein|nr:hypothetical protein [Clostridiales bacterium]
MSKGQQRNSAEDILATGSSKSYTKKKEGKAKKVVTIIAFVLAAVIVLGVLSAYGIYSSGMIQRNTVAAESEHYEVTAAMMTYFFNATYQTYVNGGFSQYMGLDTSKALSEQKYTDNETWFDYIMKATKREVQETLVLAEGAYELGLELSDEDKAEIKELLGNFDTYAANYNVTTQYYIKNVYGASVTKKDVEKCLELSYRAELYHDHMMAQYEFSEEDWNKYFDENNSTFLKVNYLSYTFEPQEDDEDKSEETTAAGEETNTDSDTAKEDASAALKPYVDKLAATKNADEFYACVRSYLTDVVYADKDEEALKAESIDIDSMVDKCLTEGKVKSGDSDFTKWAYDAARAPYDVFTDEHDHDDHHDYTVYMILPADEDSDLDYACMYRDTYRLKNYRYIPVKLSASDNDQETARTTAEAILAEYNDKGTEEAFAELASRDKYGDGRYEGGLIENADYNTLSEKIDDWAFDSARQPGDTYMEFVENDGYYILYFSGDGAVKWQYNADNALKNTQYGEEYEALAKETTVTFKSKGLSLVQEVKHA